MFDTCRSSLGFAKARKGFSYRQRAVRLVRLLSEGELACPLREGIANVVASLQRSANRLSLLRTFLCVPVELALMIHAGTTAERSTVRQAQTTWLRSNLEMGVRGRGERSQRRRSRNHFQYVVPLSD